VRQGNRVYTGEAGFVGFVFVGYVYVLGYNIMFLTIGLVGLWVSGLGFLGIFLCLRLWCFVFLLGCL